jgi:hypothetical protein
MGRKKNFRGEELPEMTASISKNEPQILVILFEKAVLRTKLPYDHIS